MAGKKKAIHLAVGKKVAHGKGVASVVSKVVEPGKVLLGLMPEGVFHVEHLSVSPGLKFKVVKA